MWIEANNQRWEFPDEILREHDRIALRRPGQSFPQHWDRIIRPGDVALDIGAYIGVMTAHFALRGAQVYSFEGSLRNYPTLAKFCDGLPNVSLYPVALSNVNKECTLRFNDCLGRDHPRQAIRFVRYDEYAKAANILDPAFVKVDIEGMELFALDAMSHLVQTVQPVWQVEYHDGAVHRYDGYDGCCEAVFRWEDFVSLGYMIFDERWCPVEVSDFVAYRNYFFVPGSRRGLITPLHL